jgi:hypothetical protein
MVWGKCLALPRTLIEHCRAYSDFLLAWFYPLYPSCVLYNPGTPLSYQPGTSQRKGRMWFDLKVVSYLITRAFPGLSRGIHVQGVQGSLAGYLLLPWYQHFHLCLTGLAGLSEAGRYSRMGDKPIWEQIGSSFIQHYYQLFDNDRTQLGAIYVSL